MPVPVFVIVLLIRLFSFDQPTKISLLKFLITQFLTVAQPEVVIEILTPSPLPASVIVRPLPSRVMFCAPKEKQLSLELTSCVSTYVSLAVESVSQALISIGV